MWIFESCSQTEKCDLSFCPGAEPSPALLVAGPSRRRVRKCSKEAGTKPEETTPRIKGKPGRKPKPKSGRGWTQLLVLRTTSEAPYLISKAEPCHPTEEPLFSLDLCHTTISEGWNVNRPVNQDIQPSAQLFYWTNLSNAFMTAPEALIRWFFSCSIWPSLVN